MKKNSMSLIVVLVCFMMMATLAWAENKPATPPNGTLTDTSTGLVWLQHASCFGMQSWDDAMSNIRILKSGFCGLRDGSVSGQWRLPTKEELLQRGTNTQGFNNVQSGYYWSSSRHEYVNNRMWSVHIGTHVYGDIMPISARAWAVRTAQ